MIIPFAPGGSTDLVGRIIAQKMGENLGTQVVVLNKPGASGIIGVSEAAHAAPDGYTVVVNIVTTAVINALIRNDLPYDPLKDLQPVGMVGQLPNIVAINKNIPAKNLQEFLAWAKENPEKATYGTGSAGGVQHLSGALLAKMAGVELLHVPYKGSAPAMQDVMGGNIAAVFDNVTGPIGAIRTGQLVGLGVTTEQRVPVLPDVPTIAESGFPDFINSSWISVFAPAGIPAPVFAKLESAVLSAARDPALIEKLSELGAVSWPLDAAETDKFWKSEFDYWKEAIDAANLQLD